jgi:PAS domain S-box-containing protein
MNAPEKRSIETLFARSPFFRPTIAVKMLIGYLGLAVIVILITAMTVLSLKKLNNINGDIISTETPVIEISDELIDTILAQELYGRRYSLVRSHELLDLYNKKTEEFDSRMESLRLLPGEKQFSLEKLKSLYDDYSTAFRNMLEYKGNPGSPHAAELDKALRRKQAVLTDFVRTILHGAIRSQNKKSRLSATIGEEAYKSINTLWVMFIILSLITTSLITRNIAGSIRKLKIATKRVAMGEFEDLPKVESRDELGELSLYFSEMAEKLKQLKEAQDKIASLAAIVESSTDAIISATLEGIIVSWNSGAEALYGYSGKEAIGLSISLLSPRDQPKELPTVLEKIRRGETIPDYDTLRMRKDSTLVHVSLTAFPIKDSKGKIVGSSIIARDITDRKKFEESIKQHSEELEQSNRELDNFASIAAHDLGAPLRAVSGFAGLLQKRYKEKLDADADLYISYIVEGAERMNHLINDLLQYARVGTSLKPLVPVDVNVIIEKTLANLAFEIQESNAVITVDPLPAVSADSTQLIQLFQNLVGNAIKYRSNTPRIHISAERKNGEWLFLVSDNGIGIDPRQFDRIFQLFQRLHAIDEYSGTGIGLATCKKIVERLGGRIWVESMPGEGSTFFFTLPATGQ